MPRTIDDLTPLEKVKFLQREPAILDMNRALRVYGAWYSKGKLDADIPRNLDAEIRENSIVIRLDPTPVKAVATIENILRSADIAFDIERLLDPKEFHENVPLNSRFAIDLESATVEGLKNATQQIKRQVEEMAGHSFDDAECMATRRRHAAFAYLAGDNQQVQTSVKLR
jgi:hypothetical protein